MKHKILKGNKISKGNKPNLNMNNTKNNIVNILFSIFEKHKRDNSWKINFKMFFEIDNDNNLLISNTRKKMKIIDLPKNKLDFLYGYTIQAISQEELVREIVKKIEPLQDVPGNGKQIHSLIEKLNKKNFFIWKEKNEKGIDSYFGANRKKEIFKYESNGWPTALTSEEVFSRFQNAEVSANINWLNYDIFIK